MSLIRALVTKIITENGLTSDDLVSGFEDLCFMRGATVRYAPVNNAEARIAIEDDSAVITVDPDGYYKTRKRFAVAHELGHFELHRKKRSAFSCNRESLNAWFAKEEAAKLEVEANEFAAEILLPELFVKSDFVGSRPSIELLEQIADKYQTSLSATAKRFIDLTPEPCAMVVYNKDRILYHFPSKSFEEQRFWVDRGKLDSYSYAFDAAQGKDVPSRMSSVDASTWFQVPNYLQDEQILEQTKFSTALNWGFSLIWVNNSKLIR